MRKSFSEEFHRPSSQNGDSREQGHKKPRDSNYIPVPLADLISRPTYFRAIHLANNIIMMKVSIAIVEDGTGLHLNLINVLSVGVQDNLRSCLNASRVFRRQHFLFSAKFEQRGALQILFRSADTEADELRLQRLEQLFQGSWKRPVMTLTFLGRFTRPHQLRMLLGGDLRFG